MQMHVCSSLQYWRPPQIEGMGHSSPGPSDGLGDGDGDGEGDGRGDGVGLSCVWPVQAATNAATPLATSTRSASRRDRVWPSSRVTLSKIGSSTGAPYQEAMAA
jgi:hypothetical protein